MVEFAFYKGRKPYDWRAIVRFAFGIPMAPNGIEFCSEEMVCICQDQSKLLSIPASQVSPQDFYYLVLGGLQ